ncbi:MAG TPA: hypothetical protein VK166_11505 [Chitinophagaceae bacterium]|nr:hypothetical protein [Chitinophagaceae bacterium]
MKHLQKTVFLSIFALALYSCSKDETNSLQPDLLKANAAAKVPSKPYQGTRIKEIRTQGRSYVISYNKQGQIDSINAEDNYPGGSKYKCVAFYTATRLDSVQLINRGRTESVTTNIRYHGNLIVQTDYWTQRPYQPYPFVRPLYYDNKKRLLNSMTQDKFTYNEAGAIIASENSSYSGFNYTYTVDYNINPLHLIPNFFVVLIEDYNIVEFWYNPYNTTSALRADGMSSSFYHNEYNHKGQLVKISWTEYGYPRFLTYIYE